MPTIESEPELIETSKWNSAFQTLSLFGEYEIKNWGLICHRWLIYTWSDDRYASSSDTGSRNALVNFRSIWFERLVPKRFEFSPSATANLYQHFIFRQVCMYAIFCSFFDGQRFVSRTPSTGEIWYYLKLGEIYENVWTQTAGYEHWWCPSIRVISLSWGD